MAPALPSFLQNVEWKRFAADPFPFLFVWVLAGLLSIVIPRSHWNTKKNEYYTYYGYAVEYEQAQRQNENNNNNNNNNNQYQSYNVCNWWDWSCRKRVAQYYQYQNNNGENRDDNIQVPSWYRFMGGSTEEERREREEDGRSGESGAMTFVYAWSLVIFVLLIVYGVVAVYRKHNLNTLRWCLFLFANASLLIMILCVQGVIETDGRAMEDSIYGWYGQTGVLLVYSCFAYMLFSLIGSVVVSLRMYWLARTAKGTQSSEPAESSELFTKPKVSVTGEESTGDYQKYNDVA